MERNHPIGIFDSGYGGLTVLKEIRSRLPRYNYIYLGDNARTPYGNRSFEVVYRYTLEAVKKLFDMGCYLVVLACNTASAKALRTIQQNDLPAIDPGKRVLGVIRPSVEEVNILSGSRHVGVLGTTGTILSESYTIELSKISGGTLTTTQEACPMWVPIVENNEIGTPGADYFIKKNIDHLLLADPLIDTIILGCTHYPLLIGSIRRYVPNGVSVVAQGPIVAEKLAKYLDRHPEIESKCLLQPGVRYYTTEKASNFEGMASLFLGEEVQASTIDF